MPLFKAKCTYCREKIPKGEEVTREVKVPGYVGVSMKKFCTSDHANRFEEEVKKAPKSSGGGSCCG